METAILLKWSRIGCSEHRKFLWPSTHKCTAVSQNGVNTRAEEKCSTWTHGFWVSKCLASREAQIHRFAIILPNHFLPASSLHWYLEFVTDFPQDLIRWQWRVLLFFFFSSSHLKAPILSSHLFFFSHLGILSSFLHLFTTVQLCSEVLVTPKILYAPVLGNFW